MRRLFSVASLVAAAALVATNASPAGAAVTIGSTFTPTSFFGDAGTIIQSSSPANSYTVPANGVITRWSFQAAAGPTPPLKLKIVRAAGGDDFTTVGDSQLETPTGGTLNTFQTRISVKGGDLLGNFYSFTTTSLRDASGFGTHELHISFPVLDPPPGATATYSPNTDIQIDVSAILEPDADQDGFGDETQDQCPTDATTQGPCPTGAPTAAPTAAPTVAPTGQRAAAIKKCKKKFPKGPEAQKVHQEG